MQDAKAIAQALHKYRMNREWTYRQLASAAGIPLTTLHGIIKRGQQPSELTRQKIVNRLPGLCDAEQCADTATA